MCRPGLAGALRSRCTRSTCSGSGTACQWSRRRFSVATWTSFASRLTSRARFDGCRRLGQGRSRRVISTRRFRAVDAHGAGRASGSGGDRAEEVGPSTAGEEAARRRGHDAFRSGLRKSRDASPCPSGTRGESVRRWARSDAQGGAPIFRSGPDAGRGETTENNRPPVPWYVLPVVRALPPPAH